MAKQPVEEEIKNITNQLIEKYQPEKIILFGSAARGDFGQDSDLDFLIVKKKVPQYGYQRMREVRELIKKRFPADFLVYQSDEFEKLIATKEPFLKSILKEGKVLYG